MKKVYITPTIHTLHIGTASVLATSDGTVNAKLGGGYIDEDVWSKSYSGTITDDDYEDTDY